MTRRCELTGKGVQTGNNVSHAKNRTRRRFLPNLQETSVWSDSLQKAVRLRVSTYALRTIEKRGGIDGYLITARDKTLAPEFKRLKKQVQAAAEKRADA
ncbi:50S ribosomal protein L28 [Shumkonia mesophila]|uniref:50S ribosomal protein L28 n=1 Tax=Shumkonia mesophila TaxID=2838854 RepID=UPI0029342FA1|nr:50S ribosomal protein L28 [Shumkonia mesophila]